MKVLEIAFTGYCVTDMKRARAFYEGVLGLVPSRDFGDGSDPGWVEFDIGTGCLAVIRSDGDKWKPSTNGTAAALEVDDFDGFVSKIKSAGVTVVMDVYESPGCWILTIADPDGNRIVLHKRK